MFLAHLLSLWTVFLDVILGLTATWVILRFWGVTQVLWGLQLLLILESFPCNSESSPSSEFYLDTWHKEQQSCCRSAAQQLGNTFQMGLRDLHWHELNWFSEAAWDTQCSAAADRDPWHPGQWCRTACICADTADLQQTDCIHAAYVYNAQLSQDFWDSVWRTETVEEERESNLLQSQSYCLLGASSRIVSCLNFIQVQSTGRELTQSSPK